MNNGEDPLLLSYTHTPSSTSSSAVGLLLHLQYYQRCEPMILKMRVNTKFFFWQPRYYNWLKKLIRKFTFLKLKLFENVHLLSISRNFLQTPSLDDMLLRNFTFPNSVISLKGLIKWKRGFEIFLIDHYAGDIGNKNITGK